MGYRFEAGTVFTSNSWHIAQNEAEYKDAKVYNPERYTSLPPSPSSSFIFQKVYILMIQIYERTCHGCVTRPSGMGIRKTFMCRLERRLEKHVHHILPNALLFRLHRGSRINPSPPSEPLLFPGPWITSD